MRCLMQRTDGLVSLLGCIVVVNCNPMAGKECISIVVSMAQASPARLLNIALCFYMLSVPCMSSWWNLTRTVTKRVL